MKITKRTLQKLIKEETQKVLRENEDEGFSMLDPGQPSPAIFSQGELDIEDTSPKRFPVLDGLDEHFDGSKGRDVSEAIKELWKYLNGPGDRPNTGKIRSIKGLYVHGIIDENENLGVAKITKVSFSKKKEMAVLQLQHVHGKGNFGDSKIVLDEDGEIIYYADGYEDQLIVTPRVIVEPNLSKRVFNDLKKERNPPRGRKSAKQTKFDL